MQVPGALRLGPQDAIERFAVQVRQLSVIEHSCAVDDSTQGRHRGGDVVEYCGELGPARHVRGEGPNRHAACFQVPDRVACFGRRRASTAHQGKVSRSFVRKPLRGLQTEAAQAASHQIACVRTDSSRCMHSQLQLRIAQRDAHLADVLGPGHRPNASSMRLPEEDDRDAVTSSRPSAPAPR